MRVLLVQRAEQTSYDDENYRPLRTAIIAKNLTLKGHEVIWITSSFNHSLKTQRFKQNTYYNDKSTGSKIFFLYGTSYKRNISIGRLKHDITLVYSLTLYLLKNRKELNPDMIICSLPSIELALILFIFYPDKFKVIVIK